MTSKNIFLILISVLIISCNGRSEKALKSPDYPVENMVDYVIKSRDNLMIEFPELYDSLTNNIAEDSSERLILAELLKKRDFNVTNRSRGNFPPLGSRIVSVVMKKGDCYCQVDKIYYKTITDSLYQMTERIRCSDSLTFYNQNNYNDKSANRR